MIPQAELDAFLSTVSRAEQLSRAGRVSEGYLCLLTELNRAADAQEADEPWATPLIGRCYATLSDYAAAHGIGSAASAVVGGAAISAAGTENRYQAG